MAIDRLQHQAARRPLRITYLAAGYYRPGGVEVYLLHYATELGRLGFQTRIVVFDALPIKEHWCLQALHDRKVPIEALEDRCGRAMQGMLSWIGWASEVWERLGRRRYHVASMQRHLAKRLQVRRLAALIRVYKPDIIHIKGRIITEAFAVLPPEKTVFHIATSGARDETWDHEEVESFRSFIEQAARVFAPGEHVAARFKNDFGIKRDVTPVYTMSPDLTGLTPDVFKTEHARQRTFGYLGRFAPHKGIQEILIALQKLKEQNIIVPFVFAGEGPLERDMRCFLKEHDLHQTKIIKVSAVVDALAEFDVLVLPSESEAMPLVLVEGLMCGRPCVATRVGGVPDLIRDSVEGFLMSDGKHDSIVRSMRAFMNMPCREFAGYQQRARARYEEKCTPARVASVIAEEYRNIINARVK